MLQHGILTKAVKEQPGHSKVNTALDIYACVFTGLRDEAADMLD